MTKQLKLTFRRQELISMQVDLLPKGTDPREVENWLRDMALARKLNIVHTTTVSSRTSQSIPETAAFIRKNRLGRDVYILGAANVGKSAFCRCRSSAVFLQLWLLFSHT